MSQSICRIILLTVIAGLLASAVPLVEPSDGLLLPALPVWLSVSLSVMALGLASVSMTYINRKMFMVTSSVDSLPLVFLLLVLSEPSSICFSEYHLAVILLPWAVYQTVRYVTYERPKPAYYFYSILLLSCSSLFVPALVWLVPLCTLSVLLLCPGRRVKVLLMTLGAAALPYAYMLSFRYFFSDTDFAGYFSQWWCAASGIGISFRSVSLGGIFHFSVVSVLLLASFVTVLHRYASSSSSVRTMMSLSLVFAAALLALSVMFGCGWGSLSVPLVMMPVSFIMLDRMENISTGQSFTMLAVLMFSAVVYRLTVYFF